MSGTHKFCAIMMAALGSLHLEGEHGLICWCLTLAIIVALDGVACAARKSR